jgi:glycerate-2-kinase
VSTTQVASRGTVDAEAEHRPVVNAAGLLDHGRADLRRAALDVLCAGLRAADPGAAVDRLVQVDGDHLHVAGRSFDLGAARSVVLLGAGKATMPIAMALQRKLGDRIDRGLVVRRRGDGGELPGITVLDADHPVPTQASVVAGQQLLDAASECDERDIVITAFTGGSSALACVPPDGVSFAAKQQLHRALLDSGATIAEVNAVRKHVSALKGGRLAARLGGATIVNLTLSDVVGDALDLICDVVVPDSTSVADAVAVLDAFALWTEVDPQIRRHLDTDLAESPSLAGLDITSCMLVTGATVVARMADRVRELGWQPVVLGSTLEGEAASLGGLLGSLASESSSHHKPFSPGSMLVAAGGEATVSIHRGAGVSIGSGGPNQEVALSFARAVAGLDTAIAGVFIDSDGSDGGTPVAGGCVDSDTAARATDLGIDIGNAITGHDSTAALERLGDVVLTGPTGTNISDLIVVAIEPAAEATP